MPTSLEIAVSIMKTKGNGQEDVKMSTFEARHSSLLLGDEGFGPMPHRNSRHGSIRPLMMQVRRMSRFIPRDRESWLDFMSHLVKTKICISYLTDKELKRVIQRARPNITVLRRGAGPDDVDQDLPDCFFWSERDVGEYLAQSGYPHLKEVFIMNHISGRKLVAVDANALVKMGVRDIHEIREVTKLIREVLGTPPPNMMRALMRIVPFETYLRKRLPRGRTYDLLTFKKFCENEGFPCDYLLEHNMKNAQIPCTCRVAIYPSGADNQSPPSSEGSSDEASLADAPTVEFVARHVLIHNQVVQKIIDQMLACIFDEPSASKCKFMANCIDNCLQDGFRAMNYKEDDKFAKERLDFATNVSKGLLEELLKTAKCLRDIQETRKRIKKNITEDVLEDMRAATALFIEDVLPITALLINGELTLESIFKQEPLFCEFVDSITTEALERTKKVATEAIGGVVKEAEKKTNDLVPDTLNFIDGLIQSAQKVVDAKAEAGGMNMKVKNSNDSDSTNNEEITTRGAEEWPEGQQQAGGNEGVEIESTIDDNESRAEDVEMESELDT